MRLVPITLEEYHTLGQAGARVMALSVPPGHGDYNPVGWASFYFRDLAAMPLWVVYMRVEDDEESGATDS